MRILAFETSCDETSCAVIENGRSILSNIISTQVPIHKKFGGVVPEVASRHHIEDVLPVAIEALEKASCTWNDIDAVAVTKGPGLVGALLVGVSAAKSVAWALDKPLIGVNHMEGHIFANLLQYPDLEPPFLALVVSGGHTMLVEVKGYNEFNLMGQTRDDAAGEAFDKIARIMGYPYPGGPYIDKLAQKGNPEAIHFPVAMHGNHELDFSFSGLKSAVINYLNTAKMKKIEISHENVAASFQKAVISALVEKTEAALKISKQKTLVLAGGVAANSGIRKELTRVCNEMNIRFCYPESVLCTDNGAMIGCRAYYMAKEGLYSKWNLNANPGLGFCGEDK
ncbi:tRNA (adenosine(37)-N6)-threonylcarbamoyltransferase complex transferase subunit TsaD [Dialister micraerophilus]|uniref:tRNA N6-adenosine threonylcarbamoyltransferase n=1 Tax=Dialister micraerophilus DSM 19965 TaxID=888062 RepID=F2BVQ9_9FIRM|nr:tRNA (adenosine(37)-N6)-threonylcarbamoyltransferase complex transferase subunit TsaD [Dialister micraerophilus]EGF15744.1 O-sialoglycoprotein endopeptidase [Dialister micraerophilus DSM 19965]MDK8253525.1 tRNA (adenosine(37)-N6)-threonylcarbamoyltransferase complex transferase subunit TsaD [Dialister micraerophilus]MDK8285304.1 tRNA (adenosine(37)-N6)-threonylcarbamoyltransferase complex transferase subunit TsaD [Dialister micraerophilus]